MAIPGGGNSILHTPYNLIMHTYVILYWSIYDPIMYWSNNVWSMHYFIRSKIVNLLLNNAKDEF